MKIIAEPIEEEEILSTIHENAEIKSIVEGLFGKAECCVVSKCGCK